MAATKPTLIFDSKAAREILVFGMGMFVSTATYFLGGESERLILGKFVTVAELGCYSLALTISSLPSAALQKLVSQVFFPMISQAVRESSVTAARHFLRARLFFLAPSLLVGVGFIAYSHRVASLLLGPKYAMAGWMMQLLGFRAALEIFMSPTVNLLFAHGDAKYAAVANTLRLMLITAGVIGGYARYGVHGAILALAAAPTIVTLTLFPGVFKYLRRVFWIEMCCFSALVAILLAAFFVPWPLA